MPQCYKCGTENELSLKYTTKGGIMKFICRPCRRGDYHVYISKKPVPIPSKQEWNLTALATIDRISRKYAKA